MDDKTQARKAINQFKKLFKYIPETATNNMIPTEKLVGYMDITSIIMIIPKTYFLKAIIVQDFDVKETKIPDIKYNNDDGDSSYFPTEYMNIIAPLLKNTNGRGFKIRVGKDTPIEFETREVKIIMAPRYDPSGEYK